MSAVDGADRVRETVCGRLVGEFGIGTGALPGQEPFFFPDPVSVALAGVVPLMAALIEPEAPTLGEAFLAARGQRPLLGDHPGVSDCGGKRLFGDILRPPRGLIALRVNGCAQLASQRVERPLQDVIERHRSNRFSYLTMNQGGRTI